MWSWLVEIYAWSTIWIFFDLSQPQIKIAKIQSCFCSFAQDHTKLNQNTNNSESKSQDHFKTSGFELKHPVLYDGATEREQMT